MRLIRPIAGWLLLGVFLMPSPRIFAHDRASVRLAACQRSVRRDHPDHAALFAGIPPRIERTKRRDETAWLVDALDESNLQPCRAAADPPDDDSLHQGRRRTLRIRTLFWSLEEPPQIRPAGDFLAMLRAYLEPERRRSLSPTDILTHYGSGPCHAIPRPRESTLLSFHLLRDAAA